MAVTWIKAIALAALCAGAFMFGWFYKDALWTAKFEAFRAESSRLYAETTQGILERERREVDRANELEKKHLESREEIDRLYTDNLRLINEQRLQRKRDARNSGGGSAVSAPGSNSHTAGGSRLSDADKEFLAKLALDADKIAEYARLCHEWVINIP